MDDAHLGRAARALRHRLGWRQSDVASKARVSTSTVSLIERGHAPALSMRVVARVTNALGADVGWSLRWRGGELDRLLDADHASLQNAFAGVLQAGRWQVMPEASFNHAGERGRMDLVAFHPPLGIVLVVEVKTVIADLQDLLGRLDAKRRAALGVARDRGWRANEVRSALVLLKSSTNRRRVAEHEALFRLFSVRGNEARRWIRAPAGGASPPGGGLLLFQSSNTKLVGARRAGRQRVRRS